MFQLLACMCMYMLCYFIPLSHASTGSCNLLRRPSEREYRKVVFNECSRIISTYKVIAAYSVTVPVIIL